MKALAEFLERPAGEIVVGFGLMLAGSAMHKMALPKADDAIMAGLTLISRALVSGALKGVRNASGTAE